MFPSPPLQSQPQQRNLDSLSCAIGLSVGVLYPQQRDSGVYECQISTTPPVGYSMMLSVVGKLFITFCRTDGTGERIAITPQAQ
uniref:Ig-like domain-containing protein n=1 Tax=Anopheles christyi TaxID=43041 RepID=A0A182KE65_9DIPT